MIYKRECKMCGKSFETPYVWQVFHSKTCCKNFHNGKRETKGLWTWNDGWREGMVESPASREIQLRLDDYCEEAAALCGKAGILQAFARQRIEAKREMARRNLGRKDWDRLCHLWVEIARLRKLPRTWEQKTEEGQEERHGEAMERLREAVTPLSA